MLILPTSLYICDDGGDDIGVLVVIATNVRDCVVFSYFDLLWQRISSVLLTSEWWHNALVMG